MKKYQIILLALLLAALCIAAVGCTPADNPDVPGTSGTTVPGTTEPVVTPDPDTPGYEYVVTPDGSARITGYTGTDKDLVIPTWAGGVTVTSIDKMAFANNHVIESVTLPGTITDTGMMSFFGCTALKKVVLGEGITAIARASFNECKALREIVFPSTLKSIGITAFQGAVSLTSVTFPESLESIGYRAFANSGLVDVVVPASCATMGGGVFAGSQSLKSCVILGNIPAVPQDLFRECMALETVTLPMGVDNIGQYCFYRCTSLKELDVGMTRYVNQYAFWGCTSLEKVYFHTTEKIFRFCSRSVAFTPKFTDLYYAGTQERWDLTTIDEWNESMPNVTIHVNWNGEK